MASASPATAIIMATIALMVALTGPASAFTNGPHLSKITTTFTSKPFSTSTTSTSTTTTTTARFASPPPPQKPIRTSRSLFGLFNFSLANSMEEMETSGSSNNSTKSSSDLGKEWPVRTTTTTTTTTTNNNVPTTKNVPKKVLNTTNGLEKITVIDKTIIGGNTIIGGDGDGNNENSSSNDNSSSNNNWDEAAMNNQEAEIMQAILAEKPNDILPALEEEDMEDIASMLLEQPPTLRQLRGGLAEGMTEGTVEDENVTLAVLMNEEEPAESSLVAKPKTLSSKRAQIKARAQKLNQENKKEEAEAKETQDMVLSKDTEAVVVGETLPEAELLVEEVEVEVEEEAQPVVVAELTTTPASLSPTHSIEEDYKTMNIPKEKKNAKQQENNSAEKNNSIKWNELKEQVYDAADTVKATIELAMEDLTTNKTGNLKKNETPGEKALKEYESIDVAASAVVDDEDEEEASVVALKIADSDKMDDSNMQLEQTKDDNSSKSSSNQQQQRFPSIETPSSLQTVLKAAAQTFLPQPPLEPPTQENIDNNHNTTNENLSQINSQLQVTLSNQRQDLGKLRKKINELEREVQRAKRTKRRNVEEELQAKTNLLKEEYEKQLMEAKETIAALEAQGTLMEDELRSGKIKLEEALEAKERVAAEYSYVINSYTKLKGSVDSQTSDWSTKLNESTQQISTLEAKLANATSKMEQYQTDSNNWREECTNKANQLDTFTQRIQKLQGTIDSLQDGIQNAQTNMDQIKSNARDEERERSKLNLSRLSDEYEVLISKKSKKIGELRSALRSANAKRRHAERYADKETRAAITEVKEELNVEIEHLKRQLKAREEEMDGMRSRVKEAEGMKEEREQLLAEIMFLSKSFEELQQELATNAQTYEDCISSYEKEAAEKDKRIKDLEIELMLANEKISQLETQIEELTVELEKERSINANLTATVSELRSELDLARSNSKGYEDIVDILKKEAETYQTQLSGAQKETESFKQKANELEELIRKTKDSLVDEKKRVVDALEEKDTRIAQLDRELADKFNEIHTTKSSLEKANTQLKKMSNKYDSEKNRADALDRKIQKLNQLSVNINDGANNNSSEEVDRLTQLLEDVSKSNDEYKSLMQTYEEKVKFISQQLLLSGQSVSNKQSQIENLRRELSDATSKAARKAEDQKSTSDEAAILRSKLDDVQSKSTVWKAQANGMIVQLTSDLKEKDASMLKLQSKLDKLSEEQQQQQSIVSSNNKALEEEIAELKAAMEESHMKAKEKMKQKNQTLKEMEDTVATLTAEMDDLKREKDQLTTRLEEEMRRSKDDYQVHERQLHQTEDRLAKEHMAAMAEIEGEMKGTIHQLETEIESLKKKVADASTAQQGVATVKSTQNEYLKLQNMEDALRRSKEKEVSLINQNMKMQHKIQDLEQQRAQEKQSVASVSASVFDNEITGSGDKEEEMEGVELPTYYKEKQRPVVIRFVGNAWRKLFRRKKNLL